MGYFITKHSFYTSKKDPISPPSQYDGKPCATCTRKPHLKSFSKKWHSYKESERTQGNHFEEQISKIRLPEMGVCLPELLPDSETRFENLVKKKKRKRIIKLKRSAYIQSMWRLFFVLPTAHEGTWGSENGAVSIHCEVKKKQPKLT